MPIYEYKCAQCGHRLEAIQKMSDDPLTECPACGRAELKRLLSAAGFQLKGSGWYATDFKNSGRKKEQKTDTGEKSSGDKSSSDADGTAPAPEKKAHGGGGST